MHRLLIIVLILGSFRSLSQYDYPTIYGDYFDYRLGDTAYVYSSEAFLYSKPGVKAKRSKVLKLGDTVLLDETIEPGSSRESGAPEYYKVKFRGKTGYIRSGDLGIAAYDYPNYGIKLLFRYQRSKNYGSDTLFWKEVRNGNVDNEEGINLNSVPFTFYRSDNRGLDGIDNLFYIDFFSEACGMQGGVEILTWKPGEMESLALLNQTGDGGVFYIVEELIFPNDENGIPGYILFKSEEEFVYDDETEWRRVVQTFRKFKWTAEGLEPRFNTDPDHQEEGE